MASYKKTKNGWSVRVSKRTGDDLKQIYKSGFNTKAEARKYVSDIESTNLDQTNMTFPQYFEHWHKTYKENKLATSTYRKYIHVTNVLKNYFPYTKLRNMTRLDYQLFINKYGNTHSKEMMQEINIYVRACVKSAVFDSLILKDFTYGVELAFDKNKTRYIDYLNVEEIKKIINAASNKMDPRYTTKYMILTAIYTGARLGEIAALTWNDIDFIHKTISINKSYSYVLKKLKETKNQSSTRIIAANDDLLQILKELRVNNNTMVFINNQYTIPSSNAVNKKLRELLDQCDIHRQGFHFHSLRHSHVAYLLFQGIDIYAISKRLGHADLTTTTKKYAYLIDEYKAKSDKLIATKLQQLNN